MLTDIKTILQPMRVYGLLCSLCVMLILAPQPSQADPFKVLDSIEKSALLNKLPDHIRPYFLSTLSELYEKNGMQPLWRDPVAVEHFEQQLLEVALLRLNTRFSAWQKYLSDKDITGMARDIILSDAMLGYLYFISSMTSEGQICLYRPQSNTEGEDYHIMLPPESSINLWQQAIDKNDMSDYVNSLAPQHPQYHKMQAALIKFLLESQAWPKLTENADLREGQSSKDIPALREILYRLGMGESSLTDINSQAYDHALVMAVKSFQKNRGLSTDGIIGMKTRAWLNVPPQILARLLALNMQRLRFIPAHIEKGILVNIPDYSLHYYENGEKRFFSKVIVGRPDRKTPVMRSVINKIVINPYWNVPHSVARQDILPHVVKDIDYLQRHHYQILSSWGKKAEIIDPEKIDWQQISIENFPYHLRQTLGPHNPLGHYKFNMPNPDSIFLHDTPNKKLFKKDIRALSSGCVRVQKASKLAHLLLESDITDTDLSELLKEQKTTDVNMPERIPVRLYYLTAWVSEDGVPQFRTDIYHYDQSVL